MLCYSRVGDKPEHILCSTIDITDTWDTWHASPPISILLPELDWEGGNLAHSSSVRGEVEKTVRQLRDPYLYEENGKVYLFYTGGGERAIGIIELKLSGI